MKIRALLCPLVEFVSNSVKNEKKFMRFSVIFYDFYVDFYTNQKYNCSCKQNLAVKIAFLELKKLQVPFLGQVMW